MLLLFAPALAALALIVVLQLTEQWGGHNRNAEQEEVRYGR